jgi:DNA ligase (NAD+)
MKVNSFRLQGMCATTNNRPDHSIAVKPTPKACVTKVLSIEWSMGLSGRLSPVANVEPTLLGDEVILRNVSMHNLDYLTKWAAQGFDIGATIMVERAGDVIPYLKGVLTPEGKLNTVD